MPQLHRTLCNRDCPDGCALLVTVEDGKATRLRGDPEHPVTRGFLCYRTSLFLKTQYSPDRLRTPLLRKGGELVRASWDEALDFIAERLLAIRKESGPAAIFHYRSGGSLGLLKAVTELFFHRFGPCTGKRGDICSGGGDAAQLEDFGVEDSNDLLDLLHAKNVILWGKNVHVGSPHTLGVLKLAKERGAHLALVDPVAHRGRALCDSYWQVRPGGDFALAMGVARVLFERGWVDAAAERYCDHLSDFRALAFQRTVQAWCAEADVPAIAAQDLAARLGQGRPCAILAGWGMARRTNGAAIVRALDALGAISGNLGVSGGGVSYYFARRAAFDTSCVKGEPPRTLLEPFLGQELLAAADPPIRAVWVSCANPVAMLPDSQTTARALSSRELVVVVDSFLTDTARCATVVLPTTTLLEADDLLGAYGHHWIGVASPAIPPPEGVKSDLEIIQALAARVGLSEEVAGDARAWKRRFIEPKLGKAGVHLEDLERGPVRNPFAPKLLFADRRFPTASGKVNLLREGPPAPSAVDPEYPFWLMALSTEHAQSAQWALPPEGPAEATVNPAASPVRDGQLAWLESRQARMQVRVRHDPTQRRDVVLVPKGGHLSTGRCANALVRPRLTDHGEGGALYEEPVRLVAS